MQKRGWISLPIAGVEKHSKTLAEKSENILPPPFFVVSIKQTGFVQTNCQINQINEINCVNNFFDGNGKLKSWLTIIHEYNIKKN